MRSFVQFVDARSAATLVGSGARVLDARDAASFAQGHLPGARAYAWQAMTGNGPSRGKLMPSPEVLEAAVAALGVESGRPVLVYGNGSRGWGEEGHAAWLLALLGHSNVVVLDGGIAAWISEGGATVTDSERRSIGSFFALRRDELIASKDTVGVAGQILDVRSALEFRGATPNGEARGGHIVSAHHLDWRLLFDDSGLLVSSQTMRRLIVNAGLDPAQEVVVYCTCGVRSAMVATALIARGIARARNYDGSLAEWASDPSAPMAR